MQNTNIIKQWQLRRISYCSNAYITSTNKCHKYLECSRAQFRVTFQDFLKLNNVVFLVLSGFKILRADFFGTSKL